MVYFTQVYLIEYNLIELVQVSVNELRHVLTQLGEKLDPKDCDKLLDGHEDTDGNIKYETFIKTIMSDKEGIAE